MATLQEAIVAIQTEAEALSGMRQAPDYAPDAINIFPFAVSFPGDGVSMLQSAGMKLEWNTIVTEIHVARKDLPRDIAAVVGYRELFINAIFAALALDKLDSTVDTIREIGWTFGPLDWGETKTIGYRFKTVVKQIGTV